MNINILKTRKTFIEKYGGFIKKYNGIKNWNNNTI